MLINLFRSDTMHLRMYKKSISLCVKNNGYISDACYISSAKAEIISGELFIKRQTNGTSSGNECYNE